jgi:hypothetical protein
MSTTMTPVPPAIPVARRRRARFLAVIGAAAAALAVWAAARPEAALTIHLGTGPKIVHVGLVSVAAAAVLAGLAGWGLLAALERLTAHPRTAWTTIALAVLVVSLTGPLSAGISDPTKAALACMHLAAAGVLIPVLARTSVRPPSDDVHRRARLAGTTIR